MSERIKEKHIKYLKKIIKDKGPFTFYRDSSRDNRDILCFETEHKDYYWAVYIGLPTRPTLILYEKEKTGSINGEYLAKCVFDFITNRGEAEIFKVNSKKIVGSDEYYPLLPVAKKVSKEFLDSPLGEYANILGILRHPGILIKARNPQGWRNEVLKDIPRPSKEVLQMLLNHEDKKVREAGIKLMAKPQGVLPELPDKSRKM